MARIPSVSRCGVRASWCAALLFAAVTAAAAAAPLSRPSVQPFLNMPPTPPRQPGQWVAVLAFPHLQFSNPTFLTAAPRSDRLYVLEREGLVKSFANDPAVKDAVTVLDLRRQCQGMCDCGLLGLAFHPNFGKSGSPNRGYFYVCYNWCADPVLPPATPPGDKRTRDRLSRFTIPDGALAADPASELVLIDQDDEQLFHTGGAMFFHPDDGFLYLSVGDEGGGGGQLGNCQRIDRDLFSGVLRLDVDCDPARSHPPPRQPETGKTAHYFVPNDNPFVGVHGALEEFWCLGLRSPHRMTLDPGTKQIWVGDVGDGGADPREEIDLIVKGGNYQWNYREGNLDKPQFARKPEQIIGVEKPPVWEYPHIDGNRCVIGGYVYRGKEHAAELSGKYVFGDFGSGRIWAMTYQEGQPPALSELCLLPPSWRMLSSFGVDGAGELYLCEVGTGHVLKLARAGSPAAPLGANRPLPLTLSATGAVADTRTLTAADGLIPYGVNSPLWSDRAVKTRWATVPSAGERVKFAPTGEWTFPEGTVFVKHFELPVDDADPSVRKRLETRLLVRDPDGSAYGVTYKWRPDASDADLLDAALTEDLTINTGVPVGDLTEAHVGDSASAGGVGGSADRCRFDWQHRGGDFDVKLCVESLEPGATAGLMARESLDPGARQVSVLAGVRCVFQYRGEPGGEARTAHAAPDDRYPLRWLRLKREGDHFTGYVGADGVTWTPVGSATVPLPQTLAFGVASAGARAAGAVGRLTNNREQRWTYPGRADCLTCHNANAKFVLGVNARQLNGDFDYPDGRANQLRKWGWLDLFENPPAEDAIARCARLVAVNDPAASLEHRARSYLDANCAHCHRPNGARGMFDARFDTPLPEQGLLEGPLHVNFGNPEARVIFAHNDGLSVLYSRMKSEDTTRMPPLGRNLRDTEALQTVREWLNSLPVKPAESRIKKRLAGLAGGFVGVLVLAEMIRRLLLRVLKGRRGWLVRLLPAALFLSVPAYAAARVLLRPGRGDETVLLAVAAVLGLVGVTAFALRRSPRVAAEVVATLPLPEATQRRRAA